jgi:hypothetical protein
MKMMMIKKYRPKYVSFAHDIITLSACYHCIVIYFFQSGPIIKKHP